MLSRNPKDALISQFFFFKKMAAGTRLHPDGNPAMKQAVAGGLEAAHEAYLEPRHSADSTYGSFWEYYRDMIGLTEQLGQSRHSSPSTSDCTRTLMGRCNGWRRFWGSH